MPGPYDHRIVKRVLAPVAVLAGLSLATAGCNANWSSSSTPAAQVNGQTVITASGLNALMGAVRNDAGFLCMSTGQAKTDVSGAGTGTYNMSYADRLLESLVKFNINIGTAKAAHLFLPTGPAFVAAAKQQTIDGDTSVLQSLAQQSVNCATTGAAIVSSAGAAFENDMVQNQIAQDAIDAHLAGTSLQPAELVAFEHAHPTILLDSCASVIGVAAESTAKQIAKQLANGANFATLEAKDSSVAQQTGAGGSIGCVLGENLQAPLDAANSLKIGQVSAPLDLKSSQGDLWVLLKVTSRQPVTPAQILEQLDNVEVSAFQSVTARAIEAAHVSISPAYGTWSVTTSTSGLSVAIKPPGGNAAAAAPNPAAVQAPTTVTTSPAAAG